jgi:hypothetical protein
MVAQERADLGRRPAAVGRDADVDLRDWLIDEVVDLGGGLMARHTITGDGATRANVARGGVA